MAQSPPSSRRIRILREEVSRKIAAGEVIDRPFSVVRELLDNAIDAGASAIDVYLEAGGLSRIRVIDNGAGMDREDLELCWKAHATSKIESEDDLLSISSLGFRGEALASIAVCSRLTITSSTADGEPALRLQVLGGSLLGIEECPGRKGTIVEIAELFYNFPARKKFLRSVSAESGLCRSIVLDRAVAHPAVAFRLFTDGELKLSLPPATSVERIGLAYGQMLDPRLLRESSAEGNGFVARVVTGQPELRRRDRKLMHVFVNRRRVAEYSLMQAVEHGFSGFMPGGWYPVAFVFVEIDPSLVDFNIHPAKKEVRFRNLPDVHAGVVRAVRASLPMQAAVRGPSPAFPVGPASAVGPARFTGSAPVYGPAPSPGQTLPFVPRGGEEQAKPVDARIRFLGQVFGVFLVFELPERLLILDQHAAHERIIFERLSAGGLALQEMMFPLAFDASEEEDRRIQASMEELRELGIEVRRVGPRAFEVTALANDLIPMPEDTLVELVRGVGAEKWRSSLLATAACRLAIKEGDTVDAVTALELCSKALELPVPRCPHGRPIWHELSEETLRRLVDRPDEKKENRRG